MAAGRPRDVPGSGQSPRLLLDIMYDVGVMDRILPRRTPIARPHRRRRPGAGLWLRAEVNVLLTLALLALGVLLIKAKAESAYSAHDRMQSSMATLEQPLESREHDRQFGPSDAQASLKDPSPISAAIGGMEDLTRDIAALRSQPAAVGSPERQGARNTAPLDRLSRQKDHQSLHSQPSALEVEHEREPLDARAPVGNGTSPRDATSSATLSAASQMARTRSGCGNRQFLLLRGDRTGMQTSPWCP